MTRLGYQIPNFTYPGVGPAELFDTVARAGREADALGLRHGAGDGPLLPAAHARPRPTHYMLECYTPLGGAGPRDDARSGSSALVTGNTYRNPTLLAKTVTTLDIVSDGRAQLGIGAGWFELEHDSLGFEFGTFTDRFEKLEEALQIILPMLRGERPTLDGKHYPVNDAINEPPPVGTHPGDDRRQRREEDAAHGRAVRRRVEPHLSRRRDPAQARRARRALRAARPRPLRDHRVVAAHRLHRPDPRRGRGRPRRASSTPRPRHPVDVGRGPRAVAGRTSSGATPTRSASSSPRSSPSASTASPSTCPPTATSRVASNCSAETLAPLAS